MSTALPGVRNALRTVVLQGEGLMHLYGRRIGLQSIDFRVESPGVIAVTGMNGSGQSTLLRTIAGLLRPSSGTLRVSVEGRTLDADSRRSQIGLASPELSFYEEFSAAENLRFAAEVRGLPDPKAAVHDALAEVGLGERAEDMVSGFSSGMKQRLRLAFAVLHRPALLLLDEPGSHLDDAGREVVRSLVERWRSNALVLVATNDPEEMKLATGRIELRGRRLGDTA